MTTTRAGQMTREALLPSTVQPLTRDYVANLIDEAADLQPSTVCASRSLQMAREALGRFDANPRHWTAEHRTIALRDAANSARLAIRYHGQGV